MLEKSYMNERIPKNEKQKAKYIVNIKERQSEIIALIDGDKARLEDLERQIEATTKKIANLEQEHDSLQKWYLEVSAVDFTEKVEVAVPEEPEPKPEQPKKPKEQESIPEEYREEVDKFIKYLKENKK